MCTTVVMRRPGAIWPLLIAANRDERLARPWVAPARHWPDRDVVAGLDRDAGGSWLGINDSGVVGAVLNRVGSLGPEHGKRSRGELVLEAIDHAAAADAAEALGNLDGEAYRPFNLVVADADDAFWIRGTGAPAVDVRPLPPGLSMLSARELNDPACARIRRFRDRFERAAPPDGQALDWRGWETLLGARDGIDGDPHSPMCIVTETYGTSSSSLIALPNRRLDLDLRATWRFAAGRPDRNAFVAVDL